MFAATLFSRDAILTSQAHAAMSLGSHEVVVGCALACAVSGAAAEKKKMKKSLVKGTVVCNVRASMLLGAIV